MRALAVSFLLLFLAPQAMAEESEPIVYSRGSLTILPNPNAPDPNAKEQPKSESESEDTGVPRPPHRFSVTIKPVASLHADGIFSQGRIAPDESVMYVYAVPSEQAEIGYANLLSKRDILALGPDGTILAIISSVMPSEMFEPVLVKAKTKALLHLKAGTCEREDIRPKDRVSHALFNEKPVVLE